MEFTAPVGLSQQTLKLLKNIPVSVTHHLEKFREKTEIMRSAASARITLLYNHCINGQMHEITLQEAAKWLFQQQNITPAEEYATFNLLYKNSLNFIPAFPLHSRFIVRSKDEVFNLINYNNAATIPFLTKAKSIIEHSRTGAILTVSFDSTDRSIIKILKNSLMFPPSYPSTELSIALSIIKRLSPMYSAVPNSGDVILFLKEIGVFMPNENIGLYSAKTGFVHLNGMSEMGDLFKESSMVLSRMLDQSLINDDSKSEEQSSVSVDSESLILKDAEEMLRSKRLSLITPTPALLNVSDPIDSLRHDFGIAPVFIIDGPGARELDDGISIEKTPEGPWIHVHIADPSHIISPSHPLSRIAQFRSTTLYLPERYYPMLPPIISQLFGLGTSKRALTFSARLDSKGEIIDYKISPSYINNTKKLLYSTVDQILLSPLTSSQSVSNLTSTDIKDLRALEDMAAIHLKQRVRKGAFFPDTPNVSIKTTQFDPLPLVLEGSFAHPDFDLPVSITITQNKPHHMSPAQQLVSECMILAGRVAAKYTRVHNIAAPYRSQPSFTDPAAIAIHEAILSQRDSVGTVPYIALQPLMHHMSPATLSTTMGPHSSMGILDDGEFSGYIQITSPLRRYTDLLTHTQLKSSLIDTPPFSSSDVDSICLKSVERMRVMRMLQKKCEMYYTLEYIRRREFGADGMIGVGHYKSVDYRFNKRQFYVTYEAIVMETNTDVCRILIPKIALKAKCILKKRVNVGDAITCVVERVMPELLYALFRQEVV